MKDRRIMLIAGAMVALCTAVLFTAVLSAQEVRAQQPLDVAGEEQFASLPGEEALTSQPMSLPIGPPPLPQKELKAEEVVFPNWIEAEPGPADITDEQAVENAVLVAKALFDIEEPTVMDVRFFKDMTGQRNSDWYIAFVEETLMMTVDSLTGNVYYADADKRFLRGEDYYFPLPFSKDYDPEKDEYKNLMDEICAEIESGDSAYLTATLELVQDHLPGGGVKRTELATVHGDGHRHPAVGIDVEEQDGTSYRVEWVKDGQTGELLLYRLYVYPTWEHLLAGEAHHADMLFWSIEENWATPAPPEDAPAVEPEPAATGADMPENADSQI